MNATTSAPNYVFYRIFQIAQTAVADYLLEAQEWCGEQISAATQAAEPDLYDRLVLVDAALNVMKHIKMESIGVAFDHTSLGYSVNLGNAHRALEEGRQEYLKKKRQLLQQLQQQVMISPQNDWGPDYKEIISDNYRRTASWR
jgi:hypothetical protein